MAFAFRKIISNIGYFKKPENEEGSLTQPNNDPNLDQKGQVALKNSRDTEFVKLENTEPDSTSIATQSKFSGPFKGISVKKTSLSDTDLSVQKPKVKRQSKKLKLNIEKTNQSLDELFNQNVENTPEKVHLLECKSSEIFSERMKRFDFNQSFDLGSDTSSFEEENVDIESLSDDDISLASTDEKTEVKMCRKVSMGQTSLEGNQLIPSISLESFGDVEIDKNEDERINVLQNYQMKFERMECVLKKLLTDFQFHIEVSKIFNSRSIVTTLPGCDVTNIPKLGDIAYIDNIPRGESSMGSWNIILEKEDEVSKLKIKNQLLSVRQTIDNFIKTFLQNYENYGSKKALPCKKLQSTPEKKKCHKKHLSHKKKLKHFDFPDIRDAMINLFSAEDANDCTNDTDKCSCCCHTDTHSESDSGLTSKTEERSMSITSSIGNFSLDSTTLTAYSESLDQVISYSSFRDTSLYSTLLQKTAIERITFYVQVHSIQLKCEPSEDDFESKNIISFHCPSCSITEQNENGLLKHILSQYHCEKIHFLYKTAYIKKCVQSGKEIQPSTVLNPMKLYRDDNKIVCFGDAVYACSLCFENLIVGESVLIAHIYENEHIARRQMFSEMIE